MADERALNALPFTENWKVQKASTFYKAYTLQLDGSAWNITDATISLQVNDNQKNTVLTADATITDAENGKFEFTLDSSKTNIAIGSHHYAVKLTIPAGDSNFPNGATFILLKGNFVVESHAFKET